MTLSRPVRIALAIVVPFVFHVIVGILGEVLTSSAAPLEFETGQPSILRMYQGSLWTLVSISAGFVFFWPERRRVMIAVVFYPVMFVLLTAFSLGLNMEFRGFSL